MPKKKGSGKLAKMTEEERVLYLEQQRVAEEELRKKKEDMLVVYLKEKLAKEEKASRFNISKLNHQWRNIMREAKSRELKKDIEILSQTFERIVDRKESVIKSLAKDVTEAEEQYAMALRSHLSNVDKLVDLQMERLDTLHREYEEELEILKQEFDTERHMMIEKHLEEMNDLADIMFAMDQNFQDKENEAKSEYQSMRDEIKNKNMEEKHALRVNLEMTVEELWNQFQQALKNYTETTEERRKAFEDLKAKDEKSANEIEVQMRKLQYLSDEIAKLKGKMAANAKECEDRNRILKEEREIMLGHFQELKGQMNKLRDAARAELMVLTLQSNAAISELKRITTKGERILKLAEMCRKLETEEEKVLPFYASSLTEQEQSDVSAVVQEPPTQPLAEVMTDYVALENFWKRYNKVLLDKCALDKEKATMAQENAQLRSLLKQYLDGISVNDEVLSHINPLFVVNQQTNVQMNVPVTDPRVKRGATVTLEAAHIVKNLLPS
ncbi:dynein regulatory complex subunit 2-like [Watersipora subatra]|uniref:dynein regulatory complex subunit 2-like n=1 Tax=Watersipora subatra TaxID=2589382 RepID=UPI00355C7D8E